MDTASAAEPFNIPGFSGFVEEMRPYAGQIMLLYGSDLVRLHGVASGNDDLYYIVSDRSGKVTWASAVGHCTPLKDVLPDDVYGLAETTFQANAPARAFEVISVDGLNVTRLEGDPIDEPSLENEYVEAVCRYLEYSCGRPAYLPRLDIDARKIAQELALQGIPEESIDEFMREARLISISVGSNPGLSVSRLHHFIREAIDDTGNRYRKASAAIQAAADKAAFEGEHIPQWSKIGNANTEQDFRFFWLSAFPESWPREISDAESDAEQLVFDAIAEELPWHSVFMTAWMRGHPALYGMLRDRLRQGGMFPMWWPQACFALANFRHLFYVPQRLGIDMETARRISDDLTAAGIEI